MKHKAPKPRVMWATQRELKSEAFSCHLTKGEALYYTEEEEPKPIRVAVIPLDDVDAIVRRAVEAFWSEVNKGQGIRAALTAAGIPCKRRARK